MRKVGLLAAVAGLVLVSQSAVAGTSTHHASSRPAKGVTFGPIGGFAETLVQFDFGIKSGTITVENGINARPLASHYRITVHCATFLGHGLVYYGGPVTKNFAAKLNESGKWIFGFYKAGGPGHGQGAGQVVPAGTCYSLKTKALAGPTTTVTSGAITVN